MLPAPQGWGNNCVISPPSLGAKPSLPEVTLGGNHRARPLRKGKYPGEGPPQQAVTPNRVCWGSGGTGAEAKQAGRPDFHSGASRRCLQQLPVSLQLPSGETHLEEGVWAWERRWTHNNNNNSNTGYTYLEHGTLPVRDPAPHT